VCGHRATPRVTIALVVMALTGAVRSATAQDLPPFSPDRPDFTNSPHVLVAGFWQVEAGALWGRDADGDRTARRLTAPNVLVRLGMGRSVELRFESEGLVREHTGRPRSAWQTSMADLALGAKYRVATQARAGVDLGVLASVRLPTGGDASSGNADPLVTLTWAREMNAATGVSGNFNWSLPSHHSTRVRVLDASLALAGQFAGPWSGFVEGVVSDADATGTTPAWTGNAGLMRALGTNLQVDLHMGRGLNESASDWVFGGGVTRRFRRR
jgi:hypothetical protein